ncbi:uncharacterized protein PAF06_014065 [Gastrophryne carolinensis]
MTLLTYLLARTDLLLYFTTFIAVVIYWINGSKKSTLKMPPGPKTLPFIGNLNLLDLKRPHQSLMELSKKYGEVFTLDLGGTKTVVIAGYEAVKDALVNQADDFGERADVPIFTLLFKQRGIIMNNGESWKAMRRFTLSTLRDFGMGKKTIEARIQDELIPLIEHFKSQQGKPFDTNIKLNIAVSNVICSIVFGKRFEYDDSIFINLVQLLNENARLVGTPMVLLYNYYPRIGHLFGAHKKSMQNLNELVEFVKKRIKYQKREYDTNNLSGYIDAFLMKQKQESSKAETYFDDTNLIYAALDLFGAGTETTSSTLRWALFLMMKYPEIQKKVQEEIQEHIKPGQLPSVEDRKNMPYTDAVIHEVQRFANIVPLNLMHTCAKDVYFRGYCIPKGTDVIPLLTSVLYDKTQWKTPYEFNPNHFLDESGKFVRQDAFMPFSAGKRICAGEGLAKMELFLFFTGLLQTFTFYPPPGVSREDLSLEPGIGFVLVPLPHQVCFFTMTLLTYLLTRTDLLFYFTTFIAVVIYWINVSKKSTLKMPPGPTPLPFIGNLNLLDFKRPHQSLMELSKKYGEVYTLELGGKKTVVLAGYKAVKEALVNQADDFGERADVPIFTLVAKQMGIIFNTGESWKAMRRFTLSALRDFGMGKNTIEARIQDELIPLIEHFKSQQGKAFDTNIIINSAVSNVICSIIYGKRFDYHDSVFKNLVQMVNENTRLIGTPRVSFYNYYPRIGTLFGAPNKILQNMDKLITFITKRISHQKQEYSTNNISGYIDAFLMKQEQESSKAETYFDDENLVYAVMDLFAAGTETTSTTLRWAILLMMKYPEIQSNLKIQEEIKENIKPGQLPSVEARRNMPYTDAVIHEVQRFANIVPLNLMHTCMKDVYFRGYCIPKGTDVIPLLTSVLYDKTQWKTPFEFNPNHFLDAAGKFVKQDAFMPFSAGKRICTGESLAKMELFLFFTGLLQTFTFYPPPGVSREDLSLESGIGFILVPLPHLVCAKLN